MSASGKVLVVGAGVAGLSAALALAKAGFAVEVLERRPYVGGRASSYPHPALGEVVDCQHVLLGCCTNLIHLYRQSGAADAIRWYDELTFLERNRRKRNRPEQNRPDQEKLDQEKLEGGGRASRIAPGGLPAPFHSTMSFLRAPMLGLQDKLGIARGLLGFLRGLPPDSAGESVASWLRRSGQTERSIRHFWEPVIVGALNDTFDRCSLHYAAQVFRESFLKSAEGGRLGIPALPLSELYSAAANAIEVLGGAIHARASVASIARCSDGRWSVRTATEEYAADAVVLALPFEQAAALMKTLPAVEGSAGLLEAADSFVHSPITTVQLWFDREVTRLHHAVLLDTTIQWMFNKGLIRGGAAGSPSYLELTISASKAQLKMGREEILADALRELALFFPEVGKAKVLKSAILKEARATFSVLPGMDAIRPVAESPWPGIFLAGDWAATGWPSTMEGAARSGFLAAEAVAASFGAQQSFLQADLPPAGLMRLFQ